MAIDVHALNFLKFARGPGFGDTATIGRQEIRIPGSKLQTLLKLDRPPDFGHYCEKLLHIHFGATSVDSYDNSSYEGATVKADLNRPYSPLRRYNTVIDIGTLEHIYNAPQALMNLTVMCAEGGQILHVLPANNYCGHGFWQFSPELFFCLYSETNGYHQTRVFLADAADERHWYEVRRPEKGLRAEATSRSKLFVLVRTMTGSHFSHDDIKQSDYVHLWNGKVSAEAGATELKKLVRKSPSVMPIALFAYHRFQRVIGMEKNGPFGMRLSGRNPHMIKHSVAELLGSV